MTGLELTNIIKRTDKLYTDIDWDDNCASVLWGWMTIRCIDGTELHANKLICPFKVIEAWRNDLEMSGIYVVDNCLSTKQKVIMLPASSILSINVEAQLTNNSDDIEDFLISTKPKPPAKPRTPT